MPKIAWKTLGRFAVGILDAVVPGVAAVEALAESIPGMKGKAKQDAVVALVTNALKVAEDVSARDLANDPEVETATRAVIDAVVAFNNIVAKKQAIVAASAT